MDSTGFPGYIKFLFASLSGVGATMISYPLEMLKTRMQVSGEGGAKKDYPNSWATAKGIVRQQGILGLYNGLSASALRQATYTGVRLGAFQYFTDYFTVDGVPPNVFIKIGCGVVSGMMGAVAGVPCDLAMTRMAVDGRLPPEKRRNYKHVFDAFYRVAKEEKFLTLFTGLVPTMIRAVAVNVSQFVSYAQSKQALVGYGLLGPDSTVTHFICSVIAAFMSTVCSLPPDIAKTRMQNMRKINGVPEYSGFMDVWIKIVQKEGAHSLWKGFTPYFIRNGPQNLFLFLFYENLSYYYRRLVLEKR